MSKIVSLQGLELPTAEEPSVEVIEELEAWLQRAKDGQIKGIAIVPLWHDGATGARQVGFASRHMVGSLFALMQRITKEIDEC